MAKNVILKTYKWDDASLVPQIDFREQNGSGVAYLYAADGAEHSPEQQAGLKAIRDSINKNGWVTSSDIRNGKPVLRLMGFKSSDEVVNIVQQGGFAQGKPAVTTNDLGKKLKPRTLIDRIRQDSTRVSGWLYTLGNFGYIARDIHGNIEQKRINPGHKANMNEMFTGLAFTAGDALVAAVGGKDDEKQFKTLLQKLKTHLAQQGYTPPPRSAIDAETDTSKEGIREKTKDFLHEHITAIKGLAESVGGIFYFKSAMEEKNKIKLPNWKIIPEKLHGRRISNIFIQATAVIFTLGFGSSIFIKEKKADPEKLKDAGPVEKAWSFWQEKPLRIAGWSGLSNTILTTVSAIFERNAYKKSGGEGRFPFYRYRFATAGVMGLANTTYALSSKNTGGAITEGDLVRDVYGITAQILNHVPVDKREAAIASAVEFLGSNTAIHESREEVEKLLRAEVDRLKFTNPWFKVANPAQFEQSEPAAQPALAAEIPSKQFATDDKKSIPRDVSPASFVARTQASADKPLTIAG